MILSGPSLLNKAVSRLSENTILFGFVVFKFLFQYRLSNPVYELHRDEFLHLDQGNHLTWGYISIPPATAFQSRIIYLLGNSEFWVRFFPALWGALTVVIVWKTVKILGGNLYAMLLASTCVTLSVLLRVNGLFQPNSLEILCWTTLYFGLIAYVKSERQKWLFFCAVVFAIGFLNKYTILLPAAGLGIGMLLTSQRKIFLQKEIWLTALLAFVLILPNLFWQYQNNFPVIWHMKELSRTQLENVSRLGFLKAQPLFFPGGIIVLICALVSFWKFRPFRLYRFLFWAFVICIGLFVLMKAKGYYAIGLYPILLAFGSVYISGWKKSTTVNVVRFGLMSLPLFLFIPLYNVAFPNRNPEYIKANPETYKKLGLLKWEDGKDHALPQDFADMLGWKELAAKVDSTYQHMPEPGNTLVLCDNYGQAGAINHYGKSGLKAVTFNADYINWFELGKPYVNLIRVKEAESSDTELKQTAPYFRFSKIDGKIENQNAREYGTTIFEFSEAKVDIRKRIKDEIDLSKKALQ
ncbi:glycosyltransferase family 39 protein [Flavobacterium silvaticum]|uniref:Glycosyltransferase family 39 protein n=1 Tax=Flavobacterium silvaticum TaxID=1852020 RepID=A0A972JI76_9FLAO|nr:glycosyltransferase family 39 protein [Flavobacterium silvaticum]NMH27898.1 glycosyltransferase family 39 protein [Flavobacterium silvaticum]